MAQKTEKVPSVPAEKAPTLPSEDGESTQRLRTLTHKAQEQYQEEAQRYRDVLYRLHEKTKTNIFQCAICPKDLNEMKQIEENLENSWRRYSDIHLKYCDFLNRVHTVDSLDALKTENNRCDDLQKNVDSALDKLRDDIEFVQVESVSRVSRKTSNSRSTTSSKHSVQKAEEAKTRLRIAEHSARLKRQKSKIALDEKIFKAHSDQKQEDLDTELELLQRQEELDIANVRVKFELEESQIHDSLLSVPSLSGDQKSKSFIDSLTLNPNADSFIPTNAASTNNQQDDRPYSGQKTSHVQRSSEPHTYDYQNNVDHDHASFQSQRQPTLATVTPPTHNLSDSSNFLLKKNLLLESFQQQRFDDKPENYVVWKTQFRTMVSEIKCSLLEELNLLTTCTSKTSEAYRLIMSLRASCASNPKLCLENIWKRMDERFGSPELIESSLKSRLQNFTDFTDSKKLYELYDLLCEIQAVKNIPEYHVMFSYFDSSLGLKPIVQRIPRNLQEKWISRVVKYKTEHRVVYPPFSEFVKFIGEMSIIRNDPGLNFDTRKEARRDSKVQKNTKPTVSANKTDVSPKAVNNGHPCLIHDGSKHSINRCKVFRTKTIDERKSILRNHNICFRCCETSDHLANRCKAKISCFLCKSSHHCTALHDDANHQAHQNSYAVPSHGEEERSPTVTPSISSKCTDISCEYNGKSCARVLPVRVYVQGQPQASILTYAMLDDQSNRTLGKSHLFDSMRITSAPVDYTLQSCAGKVTASGRIGNNLVVEAIHENLQLELPPVLECDNIPNSQAEIPTPDIASHYSYMRDIIQYLHPLDSSKEILLLIGRDLPEAHHVIDQRLGPPRFPFAQKSPLGWTIIGDICLSGKHIPSTGNQTFLNKNGQPTMLESCRQTLSIRNTVITSNKTLIRKTNIFETTHDDNKIGLSNEDQTFLNIMDDKFRLDPIENKWIAPLPFRENRDTLPDNYSQALFRAKSLDKSLSKNDTKMEHFIAFMQKIFDSDHAELAPFIPPEKERWYLPLFGVYHPRKPDQIRGVFDSSAEFKGASLNQQLLQGPDFINNLLGILIRFRKEKIAVVADIQSMFHSFLVDEDHRDYLRFLWHTQNDFDKPLAIYRMKVHVFGNRSSPSVAMYGLRQIGDLAAESHGREVKDFIVNDFYVDDGLKSCSTTNEAVSLIQKTQHAMKVYGNVRLHKFASNSREVMEAFDSVDVIKNLVDLNFDKDVLTQNSLGILWDLRTDTIGFRVSSENKPSTRRGVLSVVNRLFDPFGFIAPVIIKGKIILRKVVSNTSDWDDTLPPHLLDEWEKWKNNLLALENLRIPRVIVPRLSETCRRELLTFCDASELAISAVCYLKTHYSDGSTSQGFILGKAKVAPTSGHTIPRLELCAAVLAVDIAQTAKEELKIEIDEMKYFSDSRIVLGYIHNDKKRFFVYVANRIAHIHNLSHPNQWSYIRSELNPADVGTRGIQPNEMQNCAWLSNSMNTDFESSVEQFPLMSPEEDKEIRCQKTDIKAEATVGLDNNFFMKFSKWNKLLAVVTCVWRFITKCRKSERVTVSNVNLISKAETIIIRNIQRKVYSEEMENIKSRKTLSRNSAIYKLDPYIDSEGLLRVGGRLKNLNSDTSIKNPLILPGKHHVSTLIVRKLHQDVKHQGRHFTEGRIRSSGFWIVGAKKLVSSILYKCVTCRKLRRAPEHQKMSDLPEDRLLCGHPPFSTVGVDMFGPWNIITRRTRGGASNSKRWAALFTCLITRAVHIEVVEEMTSSSFINALRRFIAIRGPVQVFRSDRGTNFIGAVKTLNVDVINVEEESLHNFLNEQRTTWVFNPPHSSHMGGVWERMIGTTRRILDAILLDYGSRSLTHEVLTTFLAEASSIINSRPLVSVSTDPENPHLLSPSTLLNQKINVQDTMTFQDHQNQNELLRIQWKRVQHLASMFWKRWKTEYLNTLQSRRKWNQRQRNLSLGDVVLVRDKELSRNSWPMGIVVKSVPSEDGLVRKVIIRVIVNGEPKTYVRPVNELVLLVEQ